MKGINLDKLINKTTELKTTSNFGHITRVIGLIIESQGPEAKIGELCLVKNSNNETIKAEVVGFNDNKLLLMPIGKVRGVRPGASVVATGESLTVKVGNNLLGQVLNGLGEPILDDFSFKGFKEVPVISEPPNPLDRNRITKPLSLGIRAIDGMLTCGQGQRVGIFAGSGVGKSTLLGMIARNTEADINVIGLIGERGREVREFLEKDLGEEGLKKSVVIVATSDQPALVRVKAAHITTAIAEFFRDQGKEVLLMMDSITRVAMALREVGLASGEPPTTRGYPPSVFAELPQLLERTGNDNIGSITALYTVLVEGDDFNEPISDTVRGILDGHIVLSRDLAAKNHYPAIDILDSVSRVMPDIITEQHLQTVGKIKHILANYIEAEDLINIGAYQTGSNPAIDEAINKIDQVNKFLRQNMKEKINFDATLEQLKAIVK
ncbi:MAG: flagellar protein export ATPase FliI [bacterium]